MGKAGKEQRLAVMLAVAIASLALALSACTTNVGSSLDGGTLDSVPTGGGEGSFLTLSRVVKTNISPTTTLDFVGDGSGAIGKFCQATSTGDTTGTSVCACHFSFTRSDGTTGAFDANADYVESNLIRCNYTQVPATATSVEVKIHLLTADAYSNSVTLGFLDSTQGTALTDESSYAEVKRYQCRDIVSVPYLWETDATNGLYDPVQSVSTKLSYNLNFYTTNYSASITGFAQASVNDPANFSLWQCPTIPNSDSGTLAGKEDLIVYGGQDTSDAGTGKVIYHPTSSAASSNQRATFYLPRKKNGIFSVPVNAMTAPNIPTQSPNSATGTQAAGTVPPLGFAAPVTATTTGEVCPDSTLSPHHGSVEIPTGYKWVKLWLFRATLPARSRKTSAKLRRLFPMYCNPGSWGDSAGTFETIFLDCDADGSGGGASETDASRFSLKISTLAARVIPTGSTSTNPAENNMCMAPVDPGNITLARAGRATVNPIDMLTGLEGPLGTDIFSRQNGGSGSANADLDLNDLFNGNVDGGDASGGLTIIADENPTKVDIDSVSRFDYLFVVSPTNVTRNDISSRNSVGAPYWPYRYRTGDLCPSNDPDTDATCGAAPDDAVFQYAPVLKDLTSNPDGDPNDPISRLSDFPVCVIQPE